MDLLLPNMNQQQQQEPPKLPGVQGVDTVMQQLHKVLSGPQPIGTYYQPSTIIQPDVTVTGGIVPTVRRYRILVDKIMIPYKEDGGAVVGQDNFLSGDVTEADLRAAHCHIPYLVTAGHIVEDGFMRV